MTQEKSELKYEEALERLEEVLAKLESNECALEEALELFKDGMRLISYCRGKLADVEQKISILLKESGEFVSFTNEGERK